MVLSDHTIKEEIAKGRIVIDPLDESCIQPASVDLRLDREIRVFHSGYKQSLVDAASGQRPGIPDVLDIRDNLQKFTRSEEIPDPSPYILEPNQFILASTLERVELPDDIVARLEGKSSLGRLGLLVHATAGYVDPGFKGQLTLEISNVHNFRITLFYEMKISQISFLRLSTPADRPYGSRELGSKYQGQLGPVASREHLNFQSAGVRPRPYATQPTALRLWLGSSEYAGSVAKLAQVLSVDLKTVQDWLYGRNEPKAENRLKLYEVTRLPIYAPETGPEQPRLFLPQDMQIKMTPVPDRDG